MREWTVAIDGAISRAELDAISRRLWAAVAAGHVGEAEADLIAARLHARQMRGRAPEPARHAQHAGVAPRPRRGRVRSPDRQRSLERRRRLAASGGLPPALAARFTTGQLAVLRIVADEVRARGTCDRCLDEIAARAGVSRATAKSTIRDARQIGLVTVQERRRPGAKSLPNVLRIISPEWTTWLRIGPRATGGKMRSPTDTKDLESHCSRHDLGFEPHAKACEQTIFYRRVDPQLAGRSARPGGHHSKPAAP